MDSIFDVTWDSALRTLVSGILIYIVVVIAVRLNGLRTFAKMSGYDFAATVAVGSLIASVTLTNDVSVTDGLIALIGIVGSQRVLTELRMRTTVEHAVDNPPVLVVANGEVLEDHLNRSGMSRQDLWATLRAAGVSSVADATAVVFEPTGERSVLTGPVSEFDPIMFQGVNGHEHLRLPQT